MSEIVVVGAMRAQEGKEEATKDALSGLVEPTHRESGCILYSLHQGADDRTRFVIVERWSTREDLDAHLQSAHIAAVIGRADELLAEPPDINVYDALPGGETGKGTLAGATG